jgi:hypothetical protein
MKNAEQAVHGFHEYLSSIGDRVQTCDGCNMRHPDVSENSCPVCENSFIAGSTRNVYSASNALSLIPSRIDPAEMADIRELFSLANSLTYMEVALVRAGTPLMSINRLPFGCTVYAGHCIALSNDVAYIAEYLPRDPSDSGVSIIADAVTRDDGSDKRGAVWRKFRVRREVVRRFLTLLMKYHKYYNGLYPAGVDEENVDALPVDGIPDGIPVFYEDRFDPTGQLGDVAFLSSVVVKWVEAGEHSPVDFPIAARAYERLIRNYDFTSSCGGEALSADIQRVPRHVPRTAMIRTADLASFLTEEFGSDVLENYNRRMQPRRPQIATALPSVRAKKRSVQEARAAKAAAKDKAAELSAAWSCVDESLHVEFSKLATLMQSETHSVVPAAFVPKRSEAEAEEAAIGKLLQDESRQSACKSTSEALPPGAFVAPSLGSAMNERTEGFFTLCYPHLFPCGEGDFNSPRDHEVTFDEWLRWITWQDHGTYCALPESATAAEAAIVPPLECVIKDALLHDTAVSFKPGAKAFGSASGARYSRYSNANTIAEALRQGATNDDLKYDLKHLHLTIKGRTSTTHAGAGLLPFLTDKQFCFHACNLQFRKMASQLSSAFVRFEAGSSEKQVGLLLANPNLAQKRQLSYASSMPNSAQFYCKQKKELDAMIATHGQPTIFATHSFADTHCPHLHRLIVQVAGLAGSCRDPFISSLEPQDAHSRRVANLNDFSDIAAFFWERKTNYFHERILGPVLGFTHWWERTEYQHRGSPHGHALWWHPNAPADGFLDNIADAATDMARGEAIKLMRASKMTQEMCDLLISDLAAEYATALSSLSPAAFS